MVVSNNRTKLFSYMSKSLPKIGIVALLAAAVVAMPLTLTAQTNKPASTKKETKARTPTVTPFRGKLASFDKTSRTITIGERTIQITSETKIMNGDKPGTFDDAVVGENVTGGYRNENGKMVATKVTFSAKTSTKKSTAKEEKKQM